MPARIQPARRRCIHLLAVVGCTALVAVGCGGDAEDVRSHPTAATVAGSGDAAGAPDTDAAAPVDDDENPAVLGVQISGPPGASVEFEILAFVNGEAQQAVDMVANVRDEPWSMLLTPWVESAEVTIGSVTGGSITFEAVRGRTLDPSNPEAGMDLIEVIDVIEVAEGDTANLSMSLG